MKVLHIEDRFHPQMGYQINFFAKYHTHDMEILASDSERLWATDYEADREYEHKHNIEIHRLSCFQRQGKQNVWLYGLIKAIHRINPDVLYVHAIESFTALRVLMNHSIMSKYRVFFDTHTLYNQMPSGLKGKLFLWLFRNVVRKRIIRYDAKVFSTTSENQLILWYYYDLPFNSILKSKIGTDLGTFSYDFKGDRLDAPMLIYTGKINANKDPFQILDAIELIHDKIEKLYVYFVGDFDSEYDKAYKEHDNIIVRFVKKVPMTELYKWYSMADFAVFPNENTLSCLDAQACRLPVIMRSDNTNNDRVKHGVTFNTIEELAQGILDMIACKYDGAQAYEYVKANYNYVDIVKKMEDDLCER